MRFDAVSRLVQLLHETPQGWRAIPDVLNSMWGPAMEIRQQQPLPKKHPTAESNSFGQGAAAAGEPPQHEAPAPTLVLVLFLGGVSHAEIAAVRRLNEMERKKAAKPEGEAPGSRRQYLIVTTEILTPRKLFRSMLELVD